MDSDSDYDTHKQTETTTKSDKLSIHGVTMVVTAVRKPIVKNDFQ